MPYSCDKSLVLVSRTVWHWLDSEPDCLTAFILLHNFGIINNFWSKIQQKKSIAQNICSYLPKVYFEKSNVIISIYALNQNVGWI